MKDHITNNGLIIATMGLLIAALIFVGWSTQSVVLGSAPSGNPASPASSSAMTLTAGTAQGLFASSTTCTSRVVTTQTGYLMLTFIEGQTPTGSFGVYQPASTTVAYDSGLYGCGKMSGLSNITQAVTLVDFR